MIQIAVVTLFPEMIDAVSLYGVTGRAAKQKLVDISCFNPREFTSDKHRTVDDRPYGGGPGMLMKVEPLQKAIVAAKLALKQKYTPDQESNQEDKAEGEATVIYLSPQGKPLTQQLVQELKAKRALVLVAGRYEGIDERLIDAEIDEEISIGDYVLSGGEIAAMAVIDAVVRQVPGVLGHADSAEQDSFYSGLLDCPHYTRPEEFQGVSVPEVLMSGDHKKIRQWRLKQALGRTALRRPDMIEKLDLNKEQRALLNEYLNESIDESNNDISDEL